MNVIPNLDLCKLTGIDISISTEASDTQIPATTVTHLDATPVTGVFSCPDWENTALATIPQNTAFTIESMAAPVNGSRVGIKLNIPKMLTMTADETERERLIHLAKCICIDRQIELTPALAYAKEIDSAYTPTKGDICKTCTMKRRCHFYKQG